MTPWLHHCGISRTQRRGEVPRGVIIAVAAVLLVGSFLFLAVRLLNPLQTADVAQVRRGQATAAVYGTISVQPERQLLIRSRTNGVVLSLPHNAGHTVKEGDLIAEVVDEQQVNDLEQLNLKLRTAGERLLIGPASLNELESRRNELQRLEPLVRDRTISPLEFERVQSLVQDLERRVAQERLALEQEVDLTKKQLESVRARIGQSTIRSPLDGVILELFVRLGETVTSSNSLALIGSAQSQLLANVNEEDVGPLRPGMPTLVRLYSFGGKTFDAEVVQVLPKAEHQTYGVILRMSDNTTAGALMPGMTGEANIIIGQRPDALIVPSRAVREGDRVLVVKDNRIEVRMVKTGFRSVEECEILEGLEEGELVVVAEQDRFSPGERVVTESRPKM